MGALLASIDISKLIGLRDRALVGMMGYTFARIGAVVAMKVEDYYIQKRRGWVRLHEKGGKVTELPCHHNLEQFLDEWLSASGLASTAPVTRFTLLAVRCADSSSAGNCYTRWGGEVQLPDDRVFG